MNLFNFLNRQRRWSRNTFGDGARTEGCLKHIELEIAEVRENPASLEEWIDIAMIALDGASRSGHTPYEICQGLESKLAKVMTRTYPRTPEDEPSLHVKKVCVVTGLECGTSCLACFGNEVGIGEGLGS